MGPLVALPTIPNGIITARVEWMAPEKSAQPKPDSLQKPAVFDGINGILGTAGHKTAGRPEQG